MGPPPIVLSSVVSTPLLGEIAAAHGAHWEPTLTGFKWIWNAALALQEQLKGRFVFGFEEALGYSVGQVVRDKDGMSAAVVLADISAEAASSGKSMWDLLAGLARRHGLWVSAQHSVTRQAPEGGSEISGAVDRVAASPPQSLGGMTVTDVLDLRSGGETRPPWLPDTDLVELRFGAEGRTLVRPSGTEPKLKIYVDLRLDPPSGSFVDADDDGRARAAAIAAQLAAELGL